MPAREEFKMAQINAQRMAYVSSTGNGYKTVAFFYPSSAPEIKGVVQICHGMAEYIARYEEMIAELNEAGYHVCGMDMPGHGQTYFLNEEKGYPKGYFGGAKNSWQMLLTDEMGLHEYAVEKFGRKGLKYILYGHSMGSFVVRSIYSTPRYNKQFDGYVFSSTMCPNPCKCCMCFRREEEKEPSAQRHRIRQLHQAHKESEVGPRLVVH